MDETINITRLRGFAADIAEEDIKAAGVSHHAAVILTSRLPVEALTLDDAIRLNAHMEMIAMREAMTALKENARKGYVSTNERRRTPRREREHAPGVTAVGMDIGTLNHITTSDASGSHVFRYASEDIRRYVLEYADSIKKYGEGSTRAGQFVRQRYESQLREPVRRGVALVLDYYPNLTDLIVGVPPGPEDGMLTPQFKSLHGQVMRALREECPKRGIVLHTQGEDGSSILCPSCGTYDRGSRKNDNTFECRHCGHTHESDDAVAARNICMQFMRSRGLIVR